MDSLVTLVTGSKWLITTASALSPLIALLIGFAGTDWVLRWGLSERTQVPPVPPVEADDGSKVTGSAPSDGAEADLGAATHSG